MAGENKRKKKSGNEYRKLKKKRLQEEAKYQSQMRKYFSIPSDGKSEEHGREKSVTESVTQERPSSSSLLAEARYSTDLDSAPLSTLESTRDDRASEFINDRDASSDMVWTSKEHLQPIRSRPQNQRKVNRKVDQILQTMNHLRETQTQRVRKFLLCLPFLDEKTSATMKNMPTLTKSLVSHQKLS